MRLIGGAIALVYAAAAGWAPLGAVEIGGRYATRATAEAPMAADATETNVRLVQITAHHNAYAVTYENGASPHKRRGWGLRDGEELVVAPSTGGAAYGVAIYHHRAEEHSWGGPWISSLDGGASLGTIRFDDAGALEGRHQIVCTRPGAGSVTGSVEIKPIADGYQLTFHLGRAVYYRGVGLMLPDDRLAVGWSFGSAPELFAYQADAGGALTERHISWASQPDVPGGSRCWPISDDQYGADLNPAVPRSAGGSAQMPLFASPADELPTPEAAARADAAALLIGPVAPQVKAWSYGALMRQYGKDGWAERWLERQLTPEELRLLQAALRRHGVHEDEENRSIGTLLEEERTREAGP